MSSSRSRAATCGPDRPYAFQGTRLQDDPDSDPAQ